MASFEFRGPVVWKEDSTNGVHHVGLRGPTSVASDVIWTLPAAGTTANDEFLQSSTAGVMSWSTGLTWDGSTLTVTGDGIISGSLNLPSLTASQLVLTDGSENLSSSLALPTGTTTNFAAKVGGVLWVKTADVTVANTATSTTLLDSGSGTKTISANVLAVGSIIKLKVFGHFGTDSSNTDFYIKLIFGSVEQSIGAITLPVSYTDPVGSFEYNATIVFQSIGASGTYRIGHSFTHKDGTQTSSKSLHEFDSSADTTASIAINVQCDWVTASASNTMTATGALIELMNT